MLATDGPLWGHIRATNEQTPADNTGHSRSGIAAADGQNQPGLAGRRHHLGFLTRKRS